MMLNGYSFLCHVPSSREAAEVEMDGSIFPVDVLSMSSLILLLLMNCHRALDAGENEEEEAADVEWPLQQECFGGPVLDLENVSRATINHFQIWNNLLLFDEELGY